MPNPWHSADRWLKGLRSSTGRWGGRWCQGSLQSPSQQGAVSGFCGLPDSPGLPAPLCPPGFSQQRPWQAPAVCLSVQPPGSLVGGGQPPPSPQGSQSSHFGLVQGCKAEANKFSDARIHLALPCSSSKAQKCRRWIMVQCPGARGNLS